MVYHVLFLMREVNGNTETNKYFTIENIYYILLVNFI